MQKVGQISCRYVNAFEGPDRAREGEEGIEMAYKEQGKFGSTSLVIVIAALGQKRDFLTFGFLGKERLEMGTQHVSLESVTLLGPIKLG